MSSVSQRAHMQAFVEMCKFYFMILPALPIVNAMVEAERVAPGYGARAVIGSLMIEVAQHA